MPKRNRHREAMKSGQLPPMKLPKAAVKADAAKPEPITAPGQADNAATAKPAKKQAKPPPWMTTPPLSPEARREKARPKRQRNEAKHKFLRPEILAKLAERWPAAFPADPAKVRPFAIGVHREIEKAMTGYSKRALRVAVRKITNSEAYLTLIATGGKRYDLDGNVRGDITEGAKTEALARLAAKRAKTGEMVK